MIEITEEYTFPINDDGTIEVSLKQGTYPSAVKSDDGVFHYGPLKCALITNRKSEERTLSDCGIYIENISGKWYPYLFTANPPRKYNPEYHTSYNGWGNTTAWAAAMFGVSGVLASALVKSFMNPNDTEGKSSTTGKGNIVRSHEINKLKLKHTITKL